MTSYYKKAQFTVLAKITSHGSGGRAQIIQGHEFLLKGKSDIALTSRKFLNFDVRSLVIVTINADPLRRSIRTVQSAADFSVTSRWEFQNLFSDTLKTQDERYRMISEQYWGLANPKTGESGEEVESGKKFEVEKDSWMDKNKVFIGGEDLTVFKAVRKLSESRPVKVLMVGPSGYGKTSVPEALARNWETDFLRWDCANVRDPEEFFGYREAVDGSTVFVPTLLTEKIQKGNCIIVFDELNRIEPYIANTLFPMFDHAAKTYIHGTEIAVGPNVIFFATINLGYQFTGTFQLDTALVNRFDIKIMVGQLPREVEETILVQRTGIEATDAKQIVGAMRKLRELNNDGKLLVDASTRVSIQIAEMMASGLNLKFALTYVVLNSASDEENKVALDNLALYLS